MTAREIIRHMESLHDEEQRRVLMGFFKTGPGEYGHGDEFLGIKVPQTREVVRIVAKDTPLSEVPLLLTNRWHEVRLCGLLILVWHFERLTTRRLLSDAEATKQRDDILKLYLRHAEWANNWDLVDMSAPKILGHWLMLPSMLGARDYKLRMLDRLAASPCVVVRCRAVDGDDETPLRIAIAHVALGRKLQARRRGEDAIDHYLRYRIRVWLGSLRGRERQRLIVFQVEHKAAVPRHIARKSPPAAVYRLEVVCCGSFGSNGPKPVAVREICMKS